MKLFLVALTVLSFVLASPAVLAQKASINTTVLIEYTQGGQQFNLKYDRHDQSLALMMPERSALGQKELELLKAEVVRLTYGSNQPALLGSSGYSLKFSGTYPVWGPYSTGVAGASKDAMKCLMFSRRARIEGKVVYAEGVRGQEAHKPYPERPRAVRGVRIVK